MFGRNQKVKNQRPESASLSPLESDTARIAVAQNGMIVYASPAFCALSGLIFESGSVVDARSVVKFPDANKDISRLQPGIHQVRINGHAEYLEFYFDWLTAADQKRYLIGSQA